MYIAASVIVLFLSEITLIFAQPPGFGAGPPGLLGGRPIGFGEDFRGVRFGREFGGGTFRPGLGLGPTIGGGINVGGTGLGNGFGGDGVRLGTGFGTLGTGFGTDFGPTRADLGNQFGATGTGFGTGIGRFGATGGGMGLDTPDVIRRLRVNNEFGLDGGQGGLQARRINAIRRNRLNFDDTSGLGGGRFGIGRTLGRPVRLGGTVTAGNGLTTFGGGQRTFTARRGLELPRSTILAGLGQDQTDSFLDPVSGRMVRVLTNNDANNVLTRRRTRPTIATSTRRIDTTATRTRLPATLPATIRQRQAVLRRQTPGIVQTGGVRRDTLARTGTLTGTTGTGQLTFLNGVNGGRMPFQRPLIPLDTLDGTPFIPLNALDVGPETLMNTRLPLANGLGGAALPQDFDSLNNLAIDINRFGVNGRLGVIPGAALRAFDNLSPSQRPITRFPAPSMQSIVRPRPRSLRIHQFRNTIREQSQARQVPQQPTISSSTTSRQRVAQIRMRQEKSEASSRAIQRTASLKSNHNEQTWLQMQQYMAQVLQAQLQHQQKLFSEHTKKQISAQQLKDQEIRRLFSQLAATVESLEKQQTMHLEAIQKERNSKRHLTKDNERQQKELQGLVQNLIETLRGQSQSKHNNTPQANVEMLSLEDSNLILHPVNPNFVESNGISSTSSPSNSTLPTDLEYSLQMLLDSVAALQGSPDHAKPSTPSISVDTSVDMLINDIHSLDNNASPDATSLLPSSQSIYQDPSVTSFDMFISSQSAQHRNSSKGDVFSQTRSDRITGQTGSPSANIGGIVSQSQVRPSNIEYVPLIPGSNPLNDIQEGSLVPFLQINQEQRSQLNGTDPQNNDENMDSLLFFLGSEDINKSSSNYMPDIQVVNLIDLAMPPSNGTIVSGGHLVRNVFNDTSTVATSSPAYNATPSGSSGDAIIVEGQSFVDWSYFNKVLQEQGILEPNATTSDHPDVVAAQDALQKLISGQGHAAQNGHSNIVKKQIHPGVDANIQNNKLLQSMTRTDGSPTDQSQLQNGPSSARGLNALNNIGTNQLTFDSVDLANFGSVDPSQSAFLQDRTARIAG